jgi:hypothetical protein
MKPDFAKASLELMNVPGFPARLQLLYARLCLYAGSDGRCHPKHETLAKEIGIRRRQVLALLQQLRRFRLIEWTRGRYFNGYRVLNPDVQWIAHQMCRGVHISDVQRSAHRKEVSQQKISRKEGAVVQPASLTGVNGSEASLYPK